MFQCDSTLEVSIELSAMSGHRPYMAERLLKVALNQYKTNKRSLYAYKTIISWRRY